MGTYFTDITVGAAANAATINNPLGELDDQIVINTDAIAALGGGETVTDATLKEWVMGGDYLLTTVTYDATYTSVVASGEIEWPDGSGGDFTTTDINETWHAIDAYTMTHDDSGKTVTQAAVTRNGSGNVTAVPVLSVS